MTQELLASHVLTLSPPLPRLVAARAVETHELLVPRELETAIRLEVVVSDEHGTRALTSREFEVSMVVRRDRLHMLLTMRNLTNAPAVVYKVTVVGKARGEASPLYLPVTKHTA